MRMMLTSVNQWRAARLEEGFTTFPSFALPYFSTTRKGVESIRVSKATMLVHNAKKANFSAARKQRISLPTYGDGYCINEFLSHPVGTQAVLNTRALQNFQSLDTNMYRCFLPKLQLLNFEAAPVLDLRVTATNKDCVVEMLSCKFQGSEVVERQNEHFSALMTNRMTWDMNDSSPFLEVDVKLNLTLEIYTLPFTLLPTSAVEGPGNLMMQALLDRLVPLLLEQLLQDYDKWANQRNESIS